MFTCHVRGYVKSALFGHPQEVDLFRAAHLQGKKIRRLIYIFKALFLSLRFQPSFSRVSQCINLAFSISGFMLETIKGTSCALANANRPLHIGRSAKNREKR